jgi:hypothetical protein
MSDSDRINPGDDFHGWLAVGNDPELINAYRRVVKALAHPHRSESNPDPHDLAILRSYGDRALVVAAAKAEAQRVADTAQPKTPLPGHAS